MSKNNLWWAKFLSKKIEKNEEYIKSVKIWIKRDKADLKKRMKGLTKAENIEYGYQTGCIERVDYLIMKQKLLEDDTNGDKC